MRGRGGPGVGSGSVTLLMLFTVLCLTVFAVLSLSTALAGLGLAERYVASVEDYYEADAFSSAVLARLANADEPAREAAAIGRETGVPIAVSERDGGLDVGFTREIGDTLSLAVKLRLTREGGSWRAEILAWEVTDAGDWSADERIRVWDGE